MLISKLRTLLKMLHSLMAEPYKYFLGFALAQGLRINYFNFPPGQWPPPTPARTYIDEFLTLYQHEVRGRCVEFAPAIYLQKFKDSPDITSYKVWNVKPGDGVTIVGDLQDAPHLPDGAFDTIICTHVLCCIPKPWLAVAEIHRLLSPGGLVLCTDPVVLQNFSPDPWDCWRFTRDSMGMLFSGFKKVNIHCFGNAATVAASPMFLMKHRFPKWVLKRHDELSPSIVAAAWK